MTQSTLIQVENICKSYTTLEGQNKQVLDNISFQLYQDEIIAILGKSGSGKSTLLRIIAGLTAPSSGQAFYQQTPIQRPMHGIAMVFQQFALLPWLSVLENVELGLEAKGMERSLRRERSLKAIDMIGLDGFESAYPKELSGGMKQRVGLARALVVEPELLLMDEPFSALDILTAENLRNDVLDLWQSHNTPTRSILCVTHDIEEAVLMANRIFIFASDPGRIHAELKIDLPYPRNPQTAEFRSLLDQIYTLMTSSERERINKAKAHIKRNIASIKHPEYAYRLPEVSASELAGLLETMQAHERQGRIDLPELADELQLDVSNLFPLTEALDMLQFAKVSGADIVLLSNGKQLAEADILQRKSLFAKHLLAYIPLAKHIRNVLDEKPNHRTTRDFFLEELVEFISEEEATRLLRIIIDWGRYAEIFAYDSNTNTLSLEDPK